MRKLGSGIIGRVGALAIAIAAVTGCGDNGVVPEDAPPPIDAPEIDAPQLPTISDVPDQTIDEDGTTGSLGFTVADPMGGTANLTVTASSNNTTVIPDANVVLGGSAGNRTVTVTPAANQFGSSTITLTVTAGTLTASSSFTVTVSSVNDLPTITAIADQTVAEGTATSAIPFTVGDLETPAASLTVSGTSSNPTLVPNGNIVFGGSGAARTVTVTPAATGFGSAVITVVVSDGTATASEPFTLNVQINVGTNDPPVNTVPAGTQSTNEDVPLVFGAGRLISISDLDAGTAPVQVNLQTTIGALSLAGTSGLTFQVGDGTSDTNMTFTGTISAINVALNGLTLATAPNVFGTGVLTITTDDQGNSGSPATPQTDTDTVNIAIVSVNDIPTISTIATQTINEDTATGALSFTVGDIETAATGLVVTKSSSDQTLVPDANIVIAGTGASRTVTVTPLPDQFGAVMITLTVTDADGGSATSEFTLNVTGVNDPPTISDIANQSVNLGSTITIPFTVGDLETVNTLNITVASTAPAQSGTGTVAGTGANRTLSFTPTAVGNPTITVTVSDGVAASVSDTFVLTINEINDPPVNTVPSAPVINFVAATDTSGDRTIGFTGAGAVSIADPDAGNGNLTVTITSTNGQTRINSFNVANVSGDDDNTFRNTTTISGTLAGLNNALALLQFQSPAAFRGTTTLTITTNDNGNSGVPATPMMDVDTFTVETNASMTITQIPTSSIAEDGVFTTNVTLTDSDGVVGAITVAGGANPSSNDTLVPDANVVVTGTGNTRLVTITPVANQNNVRAGGPTTIQIRASNASGDFATTTFTLNVTQANDAPVNTVPGAQTTNEDTTIVFSTGNANAISFADLDTIEAPNASVQTTLTATGGGLLTVVSLAGVTVTGNGTGTAVITGRVVDVNAALQGLQLRLAQDANGIGTLTVLTSDQANGGAGALTDSDTIDFTFTAVNDGPTHSNVSGVSTLLTNTTRTGINVDVSDVDVGSSTLEVTVAVNGGAAVGTVSLATTTNLSIVGGANNSASVTFRGNLTSVNNALGGFSLVPASNVTGDVRVDVTTSDLGNTGTGGALQAVSNIFTTYTNAVNTAPTITAIADATIMEDNNTGAIPFVIDDTQTDEANLSVTATWTDTTNFAVVLGGSGMNRSITVTPAANFVGSTTVTVTVSDGALQATEAFTVTVTAVNDAPVITVLPVFTTNEDTPITVNYTMTDVDNTLVVSNVAVTTTTPNLISIGTPSLTSVTFTPAANLSGVANARISVTDGTNITTADIVINVVAVNDAPTVTASGQIMVSDLEQTTLRITLEMDADNTVSLGAIAGITFRDVGGSAAVDSGNPFGSGTNAQLLGIEGTVANLNAALDDLFTTGGTLTITVDDLTGTATATTVTTRTGAFGPN